MMTARTDLERRVAGGTRGVAVAHPGGPRRLRQRPHDAAAALRDRLGRDRSASTSTSSAPRRTPERFLRAVTAVSPFPVADTLGVSAGRRARAAFDARWRFFAARPHGRRASRRRSCSTKSSSCARSRAFPGLRHVLHEFVDGLAASGNRFVLTSRYMARALRLLRDRSPRFEVIHLPALDRRGHARHAAADGRRRRRTTPTTSARTVQALADGRAAYVRALADELGTMREHGGRRRRPDQRADGAAGAAKAAWRSSARFATSCACIARAATARSRRFSRSSPKTKR